jgi:hypothetical protein
MTEDEWHACEDPRPMLDVLRGRAGGRRLRLFWCGYCRGLPPLVRHPGLREAVEAAERFADGAGTARRLREAHLAAWDFLHDPRYRRPSPKPPDADAALAATAEVPGDTGVRAGGTGHDVLGAAPPARRGWAAQLVRCVFGDPSRPVAADPAWRMPAAVTLARTKYDDRDFAAMPLLADLLEEAGCPAAVSDHCRGGGPHARDCWVVDLVLGKE